MPAGRPTKLDDKMKQQLKFLAEKGFTDVEMAKSVGIDESTLTKWKQRDKEFFMSLKDWKAEADNKVERSLYERAKGYTCPDTKAQWIDGYELNPETGKFVKTGRWEYANLKKHYPPDPTSMIFWLKNRQRDKWQDKQEISGSLSLSITRKTYEP